MSYDLSDRSLKDNGSPESFTRQWLRRLRRRRLLQISLVTALSIVPVSCGDAGSNVAVSTDSNGTPVVDSTIEAGRVNATPVVTPRGLPTLVLSPTHVPSVGPTATAKHDSMPTPTMVVEGTETTGLASPSLPIQVRIPRIKVDAGVEVVGLDANGAMSPPTAFDTVAWYGLGPAPGDAGASVLAGHVDSKRGPAIFWSLRDLKLGDTVEVDLAGGATRQFVVESASWFTPEVAPLSWIFSPDGPPRVHLITCGGTFNPVIHAYDKRLVVAAHLSPTSSPSPTGVAR